MNKVLFDTNEFLDWLIKSRPNYSNAMKVIQKVFVQEIEGFVTGHSLTDIFYITRKDFSTKERRDFLVTIVNNLTILTEPEKSFLEVLSDPDFFDLEDGLQIQCAKEACLDYIVTENICDFEKSGVQAITAKEFIEAIA